jgi:hypothetical protein
MLITNIITRVQSQGVWDVIAPPDGAGYDLFAVLSTPVCTHVRARECSSFWVFTWTMDS